MLAKFPIDLDKVSEGSSDKEILRAGLIAELDAINFYEQLAEKTNNEDIKEVLLDVAKEEKEHVGEFEALLMEEDLEQVDQSQEGKEEVEEMIS